MLTANATFTSILSYHGNRCEPPLVRCSFVTLTS